jgi:hypothetical protein
MRPAALGEDFPQCLFPSEYRLLPGLREVYEIQLARLEAAILDRQGMVDQAAFFGFVDGTPTRHLLVCAGETLRLPQYSSSRLKQFFAANPFRTGYATHGLFPYRGKFHPQMVRGILNAMGIRGGDIVLDPMMGSGTTLIEAALMGVDAVGLDISPFCTFMTQTKATALTMSLDRARAVLNDPAPTYGYFAHKMGVAPAAQAALDRSMTRVMEDGEGYVVAGHPVPDRDTADTYALLFLAFLDTMGYVQRTSGKEPLGLFRGILERYLHACTRFQAIRTAHPFALGSVVAQKGDARSMDLAAASVDGILFSPPYSFAVDYLANDAFHLDALGHDRQALSENMIGMRGGPRLTEKYRLYTDDMGQVLSECLRVLRPGRCCVVVIGTNRNQLAKALGNGADEVVGLHEVLRQIGEGLGFRFDAEIPRVVNGISNTLREEVILFLRKP